MTTLTADDVAGRLAALRERIVGAGGSPDDVTIVAVTKGFGAEAVEAALAAGVTDVGESYAQELEAKATEVEAAGHGPGSDTHGPGRDPGPDAHGPEAHGRCRWHFLGRVQRNKVRALAPLVHLWQAVDREAAGREIARRAPGSRVLVQVNVSGEQAKAGCTFDEAPQLVDVLRGLGLDVRGLMAVGPSGEPELARPGFRRLRGLADDLGLDERSMGMTGDLEVAVQEGTTMVRVGRALFGNRPVRTPVRR
ncbi:MAG: YggS family pyridoxal phosphate enzyme [Acidimicrobiia bacterium]